MPEQDAEQVGRLTDPDETVAKEVEQPTVYISRYKNFKFFARGVLQEFVGGRFQCESIEHENAMRKELDHLLASGEITTLDLTAGEQIVKLHQAEIAQAKAAKGPATTTSLSQAHADVQRQRFEEDMRAQGIDLEGPEAQKAMEEMGGLMTEDVPTPPIQTEPDAPIGAEHEQAVEKPLAGGIPHEVEPEVGLSAPVGLKLPNSGK